MNPWMSLESVPAEAIAALSPEQQSYLDEFKFIQMRSGSIQGWYAGELLAVWDGKVWNQKLAQDIRQSDCYFNVYCGDVGDNNVAKWCVPCQARHFRAEFLKK